MSPLRLTQIAWQAFYDEIDFREIGSEVILDFFANAPKLTETDQRVPTVLLTGYVGRKMYQAFADVKAVNDGALTFDHIRNNEFCINAMRLISSGYYPVRYSENGLLLERESEEIVRISNREIDEARKLGIASAPKSEL